MAWNEPGGGGPKDPWGGRGGDQGPPDLDESLRKLQSQLSGIFGRRGGGGGGGGGGINLKVYGGVLAALVVGYGLWGMYTLDAQERGVVFRFGKAQDEVKLPGLHWNPPIIDRVDKVVTTRVNEKSHDALMLTEDENIVEIGMTVQYVINDPVSYLVEVNDPDSSVVHAMESALRHVVGSSTMDSVITEGRAALGSEVQERLQSYLNRYQTGIHVQTVNIDESGPPEQVQQAFDDVQKAKEDEARFVNEANAYAEKVVPEARGDAQRQLEEANAYRDRVMARSQGEAQRFTKLLQEYKQAKDVTRARLYIDAIQSVLSQSSKVIVDIEGGNNLLYLPLDRLMQSGGTSAIPADSDLRRLVDEVVSEKLAATRRDSR
jgi:membrane protease subunit HflK